MNLNLYKNLIFIIIIVYLYTNIKQKKIYIDI